MKEAKELNSKDLRTVAELTRQEILQREKLVQMLTELDDLLVRFDIDFEQLLEFKVAEKMPAKQQNTKRKKKADRKMALIKGDRSPKKKQPSKKQPDGRKKVAPKYRCPETKQHWTGRGKPPHWVTKLCETTNISLEKFKTHKAYIVDD